MKKLIVVSIACSAMILTSVADVLAGRGGGRGGGGR